MCLAELLKCLGEAFGEGECPSGSLAIAAQSDSSGEVERFCATFDRDMGSDASLFTTDGLLPLPGLSGKKGTKAS